jgi:hypothetical protein
MLIWLFADHHECENQAKQLSGFFGAIPLGVINAID